MPGVVHARASVKLGSAAVYHPLNSTVSLLLVACKTWGERFRPQGVNPGALNPVGVVA
jgi:hypothetical protein